MPLAGYPLLEEDLSPTAADAQDGVIIFMSDRGQGGYVRTHDTLRGQGVAILQTEGVAGGDALLHFDEKAGL